MKDGYRKLLNNNLQDVSLMSNGDYDSVSLKSDVATKLKDLSKLERHTLSDQLDIIIEYYALKKELN